MTILLNVKDLGFRYGNKEILKDINFKLNEGEFVGILGPNGSGKTTLLNNINRWLKPYKGCILVDNMDIMQFTPKKLARQIATVPQNTFIDTTFPVWKVVMMGRYPYLKKFESEKETDFLKVKKAMLFMNVWHLRERPINILSGGERQRVIIARALAQHPKLLLLDEPTSNLDINYQYELLYLLKRLCVDRKLTILTILHDINLASMFCDKIILLKNHKVFKMGPLTDVITEENIKEVFDIKVKVKYDEDICRPIVIPLANKGVDRSEDESQERIHVICGGGKGRELLKFLNIRGYKVSTGVLNVGDSDWKTAKSLGLNVVEEKPFSPISNKNLIKNKRYMYNSNKVILASIPFGYCNLKNLICVEDVMDKLQVYIIDDKDIEYRDYTSGIASKIYNKIIKKSIVFDSLVELRKYFSNNDSFTVMEEPFNGQS